MEKEVSFWYKQDSWSYSLEFSFAANYENLYIGVE
jgi:hypothetical protein